MSYAPPAVRAVRLSAVFSSWAMLCALGAAPPPAYAAPAPAPASPASAAAAVGPAASGPAKQGPAAQGVPAAEVRLTAPDGSELIRWPSPRPPTWQRRPTVRPAAAAADGGTTTTFISTNVPPIGKDPLELAFTPNGAEVAIANLGSDNVTFFDVASGTVNRTVAVGQTPLSIAATPDGRYVLTADGVSNTVSAIDLATHTLAAKVPVSGRVPFSIQVTRDSRFAVVALANDSKTSAFSVIDLATLHEVASFPTPPQGAIGGFGTPSLGLGAYFFTRFRLTPDGTRIILPLYSGSTVLVLDRATGATLGTVPVVPGPWDVDVSPDGAFAIVGHEHPSGPSTITRIDLNTLQAQAFSFALDSFFQLNRITPDRRFAIVSGISQVLFVDLQTGAVTARLPSPQAHDIVFTADGRHAFVASGPALDVASQQAAFTRPGSGVIGGLWRASPSPVSSQVAALDSFVGESIYLYDLGGADLALRAAVPAGEPPEGHAPRAVAVAPDGSVALVANRITGNVAVIDLVAGTLRGLVPFSQTAGDVAITADGAWGIATDLVKAKVAVIDVAALSVASTLPMTAPERVLLAPGGRTAYVFEMLAADPNYIAVVALDGANSHVRGFVPTIARLQMEGYAPFDADSGVALSADGSVIAICGTGSGQLELIDTASQRDIARVKVGTFPVRVALSRNGRRAWVTDPVSNTVTAVKVTPNGAAVQAVVSVPQPFELYLDAAGAYLYVVSESFNQPAVYVLDARANTVVKVLSVPESPGYRLSASRLLPNLSQLAAAGVIGNPPAGALMRISAAGPDSRLMDTTPLSDLPFDLGASADGRTVVASQVAKDGVDDVRFAPAAPCAPGATELCLLGNRFQVTVEWQTAQGQSGAGQALPLTATTGLFWFFAPANLDLVVKVVDGCALNGRTWVFAGGLTDVQVVLQVLDTTTGTVRTYRNPLHTPYQPIQDTAAFASCP